MNRERVRNVSSWDHVRHVRKKCGGKTIRPLTFLGLRFVFVEYPSYVYGTAREENHNHQNQGGKNAKNSHESLGVKKDKGKHMLLAQVLEKNEFIVFIAYELETF